MEVVAQYWAACLVQDEEPSAAVGESYVVVHCTGLDDLTTVTSHQAVGSAADRQPLAGGDPQMALVALRSCTQELEVMQDLEEWSVFVESRAEACVEPQEGTCAAFRKLMSASEAARPSHVFESVRFRRSYPSLWRKREY